MQLILRVANGPLFGHKMLLRQGQTARVGRTEWADFSIPTDETLAEYHFTVTCEADQCLLIDADQNGIELDGEPVANARLRNGQTVQAGNTRFELQIVGQLDEAPPEDTDPASDALVQIDETDSTTAVASVEVVPVTAAEFCEVLELSEEAVALQKQSAVEDPDALREQLIQGELFQDAICLTAAMMPKPDAVRWSADCLRINAEALGAEDSGALEAVDAWLADPNDDLRRKAEATAQETGLSGAASWVAMAAFWSQGSLAPADQPQVSAPWPLTAKGVVAALMLAATAGNGTEAPTRYAKYLQASQAYLEPQPA